MKPLLDYSHIQLNVPTSIKLYQQCCTFTENQLVLIKNYLARMGIEPTTFALLARRSNQLS